jgi:hypothetical protein
VAEAQAEAETFKEAMEMVHHSLQFLRLVVAEVEQLHSLQVTDVVVVLVAVELALKIVEETEVQELLVKDTTAAQVENYLTLRIIELAAEAEELVQ